MEAFFAAAERSMALGFESRKEEAAKLSMTEVRAARKTAVDVLKRRYDVNLRDLEKAKQHAAEVAGSASTTLTGLALAGLLVAFGCAAAIVLLGILRPELAKTGSCGLCIAASDRVYNKASLMPMHGGCNCDVLPIIGAAGGTGDPGNSLNNLDLAAVYAEAGNSSDSWDLKRARFEVNEHGELGPVLTVEGHTFTGPDDLALAS